MRADFDLDFDVEFEGYDLYIGDITTIRAKSADFSQVVLEGANEMQRWQKHLAPIGKGRGPHGRIQRSIKTARITRGGDRVVAMWSTDYVPAIVTSEGSGKYGPTGQPYEIRRGDSVWQHPGVKGTGWWDAGAIKGESLAIGHFIRRVERILDLRGY